MRGYVLKTVIMSETKNKDRWHAIEKLLDDETPSVRSAVLCELKSDSESGRVFLQEISKGLVKLLRRLERFEQFRTTLKSSNLFFQLL